MGVRAPQGIGRRACRTLGPSRTAARAHRWSLPPADRRHLGPGRQHLYQRWLHQLACRQDRQARQLGEVVGREGHRSRAVPTAAHHRERPQQQYLCGRPLQPPHPGVRHRGQVPAHVHHRRAARSDDALHQRQHADRRAPCSRDRRAQLDLHHARGEPGDVRGRVDLPGARLQGLTRGQGARRHRQVGTQPEGILRRASARLSLGERDLCSRDLQLAGAEAVAEALIQGARLARSTAEALLSAVCRWAYPFHQAPSCIATHRVASDMPVMLARTEMKRRFPQDRKWRSGRTNDPEGNRRNIIAVATREFADKGLSGARVDAIAARTKSSKRMIYYYFGGKEGLYIAVLEEAYRRIRGIEAALDLAHQPPEEALRTLVISTFDYQNAHPEFIRLVMNENILNGAYVSRSRDIGRLNRAAINAVRDLLQRGQREGIFRPDLDPVDLHMSISALCVFNVANRATCSTIFKHDMA